MKCAVKWAALKKKKSQNAIMSDVAHTDIMGEI